MFPAVNVYGRRIRDVFLPGDEELYRPVIDKVQLRNKEIYLAREDLRQREMEAEMILRDMLAKLDDYKWEDD